MKRASKGWIPDLESSPLFFFNTLRLDSQRAAVILPNSGITISQPRIANAKRFGAVCIGEEKLLSQEEHNPPKTPITVKLSRKLKNTCMIDYQIFVVNTVEKSCYFNHKEIKG